MGEQAHYNDLLTKEFFMKHYVEERKSYPAIQSMLKEQGYNIHPGTLFKYAKKHGIGRNRSQARVNIDPNPLDWNVSLLSGVIVESIDGFLLGDGNINPNQSKNAGRLQCHVEHEEFCEYLMKPFAVYRSSTHKFKAANWQGWHGMAKFHPDLALQYSRWYPQNVKQPPTDVRITPTSVMMWYLGDGSLVQGKNTVMVRLSTDGFSEERVNFLVSRLTQVDIACHRNGDNRIMIDAKGIPAFFDFIGRKSPVKCYDYKFELPEWRFESKRMREVADELSINYDRLSYLVKIGKVPCLRASEKGKPRFLPQHIDVIKQFIKDGVA